jgi:O-antigen/teichoic acid export membrane protein
MSEKLPRSSLSHYARSLNQERLLTDSGTAVKQATTNTSESNGSLGQRHRQVSGLLKWGQIQTPEPLPAIQSNRNGHQYHRQFQIPSALRITDPLTPIRNQGSSVQGQAQISEPLRSREMQTTAPLQLAATNKGGSFSTRSSVLQASYVPFDIGTIAPHQQSTTASVRSQAWKPGSFGFEHDDAWSQFEKEDTFSMLVLKGVSNQQGQATPVMQSELSGAAGSAAIVGVGTIVGNMFKYGNNFMIQRGFGPGLYGLYTLSYAIVTLVSSIFNLGLDDAMVRYTSVYRGKKQPKLLRGLAIFCSALVGVAGMVGAMIVYFMLPSIVSVRHSVAIVPVLLIMIPIIPFICMQVVWSAGLQGFKEFKWRVLTQRLLIPGVLLMLLIPVLIFFHDITSVAIALLLSIMICTIVSFYLYFRKLTSISQQRAREYDLREWTGFAIPNFLTSIVDTVLDSVDTVLLAIFAITNVAIGQYGAAIRIAIFVSMPLQSFNTMFSPTIAELYSKGENQKLSAMFKIVTKWALTFSLPIFWVAVLFAQPLLGISGSGFVPAWPLLIALAIGNLINVATGSVGYMLLMTGHQKITFLNSLVAIVFNIVLGVLLIPRYGAMGVAVATGVALSVVNLMRLLQVYYFLKMTPFRWDTLKPIGASLMSAVVTAGMIYWLSLTNFSIHLSRLNISIELALIPVFIALYIGLLAVFRISPEDQIVLDALRRKLKRGKK